MTHDTQHSKKREADICRHAPPPTLQLAPQVSILVFLLCLHSRSRLAAIIESRKDAIDLHTSFHTMPDAETKEGKGIWLEES